MSGSKRPDPDPSYCELVDLCDKHGLRVGLCSTVYHSNGETKSSITYLEVNNVLHDECSQVVKIAVGSGGVPEAAVKALRYLRKQALIP